MNRQAARLRQDAKMTVAETDLQMLELFLDGELSVEETAALSARFESEPSLVEALSRLSGERESRRMVFDSLEPSEGATNRLVKSIRAGVGSALAREAVWVERSRLFRRSGVVAACLMFAFIAGWLGREKSGTLAPTDHSVMAVSDNPGRTVIPTESPGQNNVAVAKAPQDQNDGQLVFDPNPIRSLHVPPLFSPNEARAPQGYVVRLTDASGQMVGMQRFDTIEEAERFADNFHRLHQETQRLDPPAHDARGPRGNAVLVKEEF